MTYPIYRDPNVAAAGPGAVIVAIGYPFATKAVNGATWLLDADDDDEEGQA
jgi:hypothetical protein